MTTKNYSIISNTCLKFLEKNKLDRVLDEYLHYIKQSFGHTLVKTNVKMYSRWKAHIEIYTTFKFISGIEKANIKLIDNLIKMKKENWENRLQHVVIII